MAVRDVFYIFDKNLKDATDNIKNIKLRSAAVHALIKSYKLLPKCIVSPITLASVEDLLTFHSRDYVDYLKKAQNSQDLEKIDASQETADFNLEYDCPLFPNIMDFALMMAGGTLSAARILCSHEVLEENCSVSGTVQPKSYLKFQESKDVTEKSDVYDMPGDLSFDENMMMTMEAAAPRQPRQMLRHINIQKDASVERSQRQKVVLNWFGGWHHAQRDSAEGFCYVNDIVIGIQHLLKYYKRVLYVDLDVHHGIHTKAGLSVNSNGVENAFAHTPHVMTVSFHKHGVGYYPGTGGLDDIGIGRGLYHSVNVPLKDGITDGPYMDIFTKIMNRVKKVYDPECIVLQCGADCLAGDPLGGFNLSLRGIGYCVQYLTDWKLPSIILGGGGYNIANAARCYAYLTSIVLNEKLDKNIPENDFFHIYGPSFELDVTTSLRKNENVDSEVKIIVEKVLSNLDHTAVQ